MQSQQDLPVDDQTEEISQLDLIAVDSQKDFTLAAAEDRSSTKNITLEASYTQRPINLKMPTFNAEVTKKEPQA